MRNLSFAGLLQQLALRHSLSSVFSDFLEMVICALSMGALEERYLEIVGRYEKSQVNLLADAFGALVLEMDNHGDGLRDVLGDFFMELISHGHNGQFFTPDHICTLMAQLNHPIPDGANILDCACGSGRTLMAAAGMNRNALFFGADIDRNCALMAAINFCLNGMFGEVAWMDSLSNHFFGGCEIRPYPGHGNPYLVPLVAKESLIVKQKNITAAPPTVQPATRWNDPLDELLHSSSCSGHQSVPSKASQLSLF